MEKKIPSRKYLTILSVLLVAVIALAVTGAYHANSFRSQPIFLFILIIGLGLSLGLGMVRGRTGSVGADRGCCRDQTKPGRLASGEPGQQSD